MLWHVVTVCSSLYSPDLGMFYTHIHNHLPAVFACIATLLIVPASILVARLGRNSSHWFNIHRWLNISTTVFITATFALGTAAVMIGGHHEVQLIGKGSDIHHQVGFAVFLLVWAQVGLGFISHKTASGHFQTLGVDGLKSVDEETGNEKTEQKELSSGHRLPSIFNFPSFRTTTSLSKKHPLRYVHIFLGLAITGILYWLVWDGIYSEWPSAANNGSSTPKSIMILFWILLGVFVAVYMGAIGRGLISLTGRKVA